jgi:hypothetical protein
VQGRAERSAATAARTCGRRRRRLQCARHRQRVCVVEVGPSGDGVAAGVGVRHTGGLRRTRHPPLLLVEPQPHPNHPVEWHVLFSENRCGGSNGGARGRRMGVAVVAVVVAVAAAARGFGGTYRAGEILALGRGSETKKICMELAH